MEENGIQIEPACSEDYFVVNVQTTTAQIDLTLEILDEVLNNSTMDDYEIEKKRSEILNKIRQQRDIPMNIALEEFKTKIFENSVYSHTNKVLEKTLPTVTRENVVNYYNKIFDSKNVIVSVNGNVDTDKLINAFGSILSDRKQPVFEYSRYRVTKLNNPKTYQKDIVDLKTAWLFLGWQTDGIYDKKDFVTLMGSILRLKNMQMPGQI